jgi:adenine phosphoribosyltransferase
MITDKKIISLIRDVPDFPKKGIVYKDITPLLADPKAFKAVVDEFVKILRGKNITRIVGIESRGFIFASAAAYAMGVGFVPVRKHGKLPHITVSEAFELEYGADKIEMHKDALTIKDRVAIIDDLLATGGTMKAAVSLVKRLGAHIECCVFLCELDFLKGRNTLNAPVEALIKL